MYKIRLMITIFIGRAFHYLWGSVRGGGGALESTLAFLTYLTSMGTFYIHTYRGCRYERAAFQTMTRRSDGG